MLGAPRGLLCQRLLHERFWKCLTPPMPYLVATVSHIPQPGRAKKTSFIHLLCITLVRDQSETAPLSVCRFDQNDDVQGQAWGDQDSSSNPYQKSPCASLGQGRNRNTNDFVFSACLEPDSQLNLTLPQSNLTHTQVHARLNTRVPHYSPGVGIIRVAARQCSVEWGHRV